MDEVKGAAPPSPPAVPVPWYVKPIDLDGRYYYAASDNDKGSIVTRYHYDAIENDYVTDYGALDGTWIRYAGWDLLDKPHAPVEMRHFRGDAH